MVNPEHLEILKQGVEVWNRWRRENPDICPELRGAKLRGSDLSGANLHGAMLLYADLRGAKLSGAQLSGASANYLHGADLRGANLSSAYLDHADLCEADLCEADLSWADLRGADLRRANLSGADLSDTDLIWTKLSETNLSEAFLYMVNLHNPDLNGADFTRCKVGDTTFGDVDLSTVKGLDTVIHEGPSTIGIDTLYRSGGNIPEVFLRGAGVPEQFIEYARSLVGQAIQYYSCFISHSHNDKRFCDRIYADLQARGVRVWYFSEDATWGKTVWGEIDRSIRIYDRLLVICSETSLQSGPVLREIERALQREDREGRNVLFPIRLDDYLFDKWEHERKADVVAKVVGDFRGWDTDAAKYEAQFERLMKALEGD